MKRIVFTLFIIFIISTIAVHAEDSDFDIVFKKIAAKLSEAGPKLPDKTVAVYGFETIGRPGDDFAEYSTEKLTHEIVTVGTFLVIERSRINEILKEQSLSLSGMVDANTASKIGKILAVDAVIIGSIHVTDNGIEFIARIIGSERGVIIASADERLKLTADVSTKNISPVKGTVQNEESTKEDSTNEESVKEENTKEIKKADSGSNAFLSTDKAIYAPTDKITVTFSGFPGNKLDWITIVAAGKPDDTYNQWHYTDGKKTGTLVFNKLAPGDYEVRGFFNWPDGGYIVHTRAKIKVVK